MIETPTLLNKIVRRSVPVELRSYLTRRPSVVLDAATWDREYATGEWSRLGNLDEMSRYALIAGYIRNIGPAVSVLDVGCGEGHLASWLPQNGEHRYLGIDLSDVAIQKARVRACNGARFEVAAASTFQTDARFDIIVFNEVLYYIDRPGQALERYGGFLTPRGLLIISMYRIPGALNIWRRVASRLEVLDSVALRNAHKTEWNVRLCRLRPRPAARH
jgi:2-polyprenyl-3-methyl-5-hydroxy-6-metoxy-1,4-benzoquinol methylase